MKAQKLLLLLRVPELAPEFDLYRHDLFLATTSPAFDSFFASFLGS
tara:strand:- start:57 stop:194 length:138 start_codon:yes stop_codon:yes gene_type:complete